MDFIRSAYRANVRMFRDDDQVVVPITWYFVPPDRKALGFPSAFCSRNWERREWGENPIIGEQSQPRAWRSGLAPTGASYPGLCGSEDQWQRGALTTDARLEPWPNSNVPTCCKGPPIPFAGGVGAGAYPLPNCPPCYVLPNPFYGRFHVTGFSCPGLDGLVLPFIRPTGDCISAGGVNAAAMSPTTMLNGTPVIFILACGVSFSPVYHLFGFVPDCLGVSLTDADVTVSSCFPFVASALSSFHTLIPGCNPLIYSVDFFQ